MAQETCRHQGCTCAARRDGYCSDICAAGEDAGVSDGQHLCACGHDACVPPTKAEGWGTVAELAPEGRFVGGYGTRDW